MHLQLVLSLEITYRVSEAVLRKKIYLFNRHIVPRSDHGFERGVFLEPRSKIPSTVLIAYYVQNAHGALFTAHKVCSVQSVW